MCVLKLFSLLHFRAFPMDMAGFAVHVKEFLGKKYIKMGFVKAKGRQRPVKPGYLETSYLEHFASKSSVECRSPENEARYFCLMSCIYCIHTYYAPSSQFWSFYTNKTTSTKRDLCLNQWTEFPLCNNVAIVSRTKLNIKCSVYDKKVPYLT